MTLPSRCSTQRYGCRSVEGFRPSYGSLATHRRKREDRESWAVDEIDAPEGVLPYGSPYNSSIVPVSKRRTRTRPELKEVPILCWSEKVASKVQEENLGKLTYTGLREKVVESLFPKWFDDVKEEPLSP